MEFRWSWQSHTYILCLFSFALDLTELWGSVNALGGMGLVSCKKWTDTFSVIMKHDHEECREEMCRYKSVSVTPLNWAFTCYTSISNGMIMLFLSFFILIIQIAYLHVCKGSTKYKFSAKEEEKHPTCLTLPHLSFLCLSSWQVINWQLLLCS